MRLWKHGMLAQLCVMSAALMLSACGAGNESERARENGVSIVAVSTPALGRMVEEIGGDSVRAVVLIPAGADPENYEPDITTMKAAAEAQALLTLNTEGFEQSITSRLAGVMPDLKTSDLSRGVQLLTGTHSHGDPHLLSSPRNARQIARNMRDRLVELMPQLSAGITGRAQRLDSLLAATDRKIAAGLPDEGATFVVMHPSMSYFARDYGMRQIALEEDGKEPSPRQLAERLDAARAAGARVLVTERGRQSTAGTTLASQYGLEEIRADFNAADFIEQYAAVAGAMATRKTPR